MGPWTLTISPFWCGVIATEALNLAMLITLAVYLHYRRK